jgi:hypothetical protein
MGLISTIAEVIRDLLIFVVVMSALLVLLIVIVARMPESNPLKRLLNALCYRVAATVLAGLVAIPLEPIPGIDIAYDLAVPVALLFYWLTLFRSAGPDRSAGPRGEGRRGSALNPPPTKRSLPGSTAIR